MFTCSSSSVQLASEDDDRCDDEQGAEDAEAETIDDHRQQLPLAAQLLVPRVFPHLARQHPQLRQDGRQLSLQHPGSAHSVITNHVVRLYFLQHV